MRHDVIGIFFQGNDVIGRILQFFGIKNISSMNLDSVTYTNRL